MTLPSSWLLLSATLPRVGCDAPVNTGKTDVGALAATVATRGIHGWTCKSEKQKLLGFTKDPVGVPFPVVWNIIDDMETGHNAIQRQDHLEYGLNRRE